MQSGSFLKFLVRTPFCCFLGKIVSNKKRFSCYWNYNCFFHINQSHICPKTSSIWPNGMKKNTNITMQPNFFPEIFGGPHFPFLKKKGVPTILKRGGKKKTLERRSGFSAFTWSNQSFGAKDLPVGSTLGLLGAVGSPEIEGSPI